MRYTTRLPSVYFDPSDLTELETLFLHNTTDANISIEASSGAFTHTYDCIDDLIADPLIPEILTGVEIRMNGREGRINLTLSDSHPSIENLTIYGERGWVRMKTNEITDFFENRKNLFRTIIPPTILSFLLIVIVGLSFTGLVYLIGLITGRIQSMTDLIILVAIAILVIFRSTSSSLISIIYPYYFVKQNPNKEYNPHLRRIFKTIMLLAAVASLISSPFALGLI